MRLRKHQDVLPGRTLEQERRGYKRLLGYASLLALPVALRVILTPRGIITRAVTKNSDVESIGDARLSRQSLREAEKVVDREEGWNGVAMGLPSMPRSEVDIHVVFSTDCSPYQNYQSILLFHSAEMVGQGPITRVASGCSREEEEELQALMDKQPERFRVHFTPDYSWDRATGQQFMYYNKPNGMAHFLKNADPPVEETVIALVDPDMYFVKRLTPFVGDHEAMLWLDENSKPGADWAVEGVPVAQFYALGGGWADWPDLANITKKLGSDSPVNQLGVEAASSGYPVGPPYMLHARDWTRVIDLWADVCPEVYATHSGILTDMYAYCIATAHIGLRHRVALALMVSFAGGGDIEGWPLVDKFLGTQTCDASAIEEHQEHLPTVIHYCQMYRMGTYVFPKRHDTLKKVFNCAADSLQVLPPDYPTSPMGTLVVRPMERENITTYVSAHMGYMLCSLLRGVNAAQAAYKKRYCAPEDVSGGVMRLTDLRPEEIEADQYGR